MDEDKYVEDAIGVQVKVLDTVIVEEIFEEVVRWESQPALHESREHQDLVGTFLHRVGSLAAACHMSTSFSQRNPLFKSANRSSVFALDFFQSLFGFGRGGDTSGVDPPADPAAS
jgi:hypothetical protein